MTQRMALLLRAINVGGRKLPMADLRALLEELGHTEVKTILASGQAVVTSDRDPGEVAAELEKRLLERQGLKSEVMVRTGAELAAIIEANPFPTADDDGARHAVVFLRHPASQQHLARLDAVPSDPDEYVARNSEIYLRLPNGSADSKLAIAVVNLRELPGTTRNWNTVRKLAALTQP